MRAGALIEYRLKLHGVPVRWRTQIESFDPPHAFTDVQLSGPYRLWHHTHVFEPDGRGGTIMRDRVLYALPFGPLGRPPTRCSCAATCAGSSTSGRRRWRGRLDFDRG